MRGWYKSGENRSKELSNARNSIENGFPVQKYVGALVRLVIRVAIAFENEPFDHGCSSSTFQMRPETQETTDFLYEMSVWLLPAWKCGSHVVAWQPIAEHN